MVLWNFDLLWKTMVLWKKLWYYGQNYGSILRTMELRFTKKKKHVRLPKSKETLIYNEKTMEIYQNN